jgi:hypothetical protein
VESAKEPILFLGDSRALRDVRGDRTDILHRGGWAGDHSVCAGEAQMKLGKLNHNRHPELVSGSILPQALAARAAEWMLKQVQHDGN